MTVIGVLNGNCSNRSGHLLLCAMRLSKCRLRRRQDKKPVHLVDALPLGFNLSRISDDNQLDLVIAKVFHCTIDVFGYVNILAVIRVF